MKQSKSSTFFKGEDQALSMERKNTVKRYVDPFNFSIYDCDSRILKISISPNSTVGELIAQVKAKLNQKGIIGLISRDNNQIIDYALKVKNLSLSAFQNQMSFEIQKAGQVVNLNEPTLDDFQFLKLLGSGVSASVYLVRHRCNGMLYALKQINKSYFKDFKRIQQVLRERKIMIDMIQDFPFTTKLQAAFESEKFLNFVIEFYPGGQMFVHLQRKRLTESQAKIYVAQMILTFEKLHEKKIIYRDLKPENIMIDFDGHARLGDFGLCKLNLDYYDMTYSYCGSQEYMAPQVRTQNGYNYGVDFYTLGSFAYQMVHGVPPYYNNQPLFFQESVSDEYIELISRLIDGNMHKRLKSFNEIRRMKWFKDLDWRKVQQKKYDMAFKIDISQNYIGEEFKGQTIDPQCLEQKSFDKLLECFAYIRKNENVEYGIAEFYNCGMPKRKAVKKSSSHKKRHSITEGSSSSKSRKNSLSGHSNSKSLNKTSKRSLSKTKTNIYHSSRGQLKNFYNKKFGPKNIYTNDKMVNGSSNKKSSRKLFNSKNSKQGQGADIAESINSRVVANNKKLQQKQESKKLTMKKVKSSANINMAQTKTIKQVMNLEKLFSPKKYKSPSKNLSKTQI